jgi:hypothetical protein
MVRSGVAASRSVLSVVLLGALACSQTGKVDDGEGGRGGGMVTTGAGGAGGGCPQGGQFYCGCTAAPTLAVCVGGQWTCASGIPAPACDPCALELAPHPGCSCSAGDWTCATDGGSADAGGGGAGAGGSGGASAGSGGGGAGAGGGGTSCASVTALEACDARSDCHAVFVDPGTCGCGAPGCCARFSRCADGDRAQCTPDGLACLVVTPHCESPYTVSYANLCYEGCVRNTECMPAP